MRWLYFLPRRAACAWGWLLWTLFVRPQIQYRNHLIWRHQSAQGLLDEGLRPADGAGEAGFLRAQRTEGARRFASSGASERR